MRVGIVVDAGCDLPESFLDRNQVQVLPLTVTTPSGELNDRRQKSEALNFYQQWRNKPSFAPKLSALSVDQFSHVLKEELIYQFDHILILAPHLKMSSTLSSVREGILSVQPQIETLRKQAQLQKPFKVRVIESHSGFSGYGMAVYESLRLMGEKARSVDQLKRPLEQFIPHLETYLMPGPDALSGAYLKSPPFSQGWLAMRKNQMKRQLPAFLLDQKGIEVVTHCDQQNPSHDFLSFVQRRLTPMPLHNRLVCLSYAGNLSHLRVHASYKALETIVQEKQGRLLSTIMGPANATRLGAGAISVAFAKQL